MSINFIEINLIWISIAIITFVVLVFFNVTAPYGRHTNDRWGIMISNRLGWIIMELPALLIMPTLTLYGSAEKNTATYIIVSLWVIHYFNRTLIFPFKIKTKNKKMPIMIMISAVLFNCVNGFFNGYYLGYLNEELIQITSIQFLIGITLFIIGMYINAASDKKLISLRSDSKEYQIPHGGLFKYVSCPNHFGEVVEWLGFAIICWNIPALGFAIWTFCNLSPRSINHHQWYNNYFKEYPKNRRAIIPFIL